MKRSTITGAWLVSAAMILVACGGSASTDNRSRNILGSDGYEVPRVLTYEYEDVYDKASSRPWSGGFSSAGADRWDSSLYATGEGRARLAAHTYEQVGPAVPPRSNRPSSVAPPIYERPVSSKVGATRNFGTVTPKVPSGATMVSGNLGKVLGGLGNVGMSMGAMVAVAGLGMALDALGAPPFLTALFGGPDPQIMAALQQIMQTLEEMNKKLDQINEKLDNVQDSLNSISSALQLLSSSVCSSSVTSTANELARVIQPIRNRWNDVYINYAKKDRTNSNTFSSDDLDYFNTQLSAIKKIEPRTAIEKIEDIVIGSGDLSGATASQSGLLSQVQKCTLANNRFLTNQHTSEWQSLVLLAMAADAQAAELDTWAELYSSMIQKKSPSLTNLNLTNLTLRRSLANLGFQVSMQIPDGQVLDTVTNKMWRMAPSGTSKVSLNDALKACVSDEETFLNYAPVPSWSGTATRDLNRCVATEPFVRDTKAVPLDRGANTDPARDVDPLSWRVPTIGEITKVPQNFSSTASTSNVGLIDGGTNKSGTRFDGWSTSMCGTQRARNCATPADYLSTYGYSGVPTDLNVVWSNTTAAKVQQAGTLPYWTKPFPVDTAYSIYNSTGGPRDSKLYGFCEDDEPMYYGKLAAKYQFVCGNFLVNMGFLTDYKRVPAIPVNATSEPSTRRDHMCFRLTSKITKDGHTADEWSNWNNTEIVVANLGSKTANTDKVEMPWGAAGAMQNLTTPGQYRPTEPGKTNLYFANRTPTASSFACIHDWYDTTVVKLPQTAQAMWVRNLAPNESYYSVTSSTGPIGIPELRSFATDLTPPAVSIFSMNGRAVIHGSSSTAYVIKCLINPATDPKSADDVLASGTDCPTSFDDFADGPYRVYAVASRKVNDRPVSSDLEIADIAISHVFQNASPGPTTANSVFPSSTANVKRELTISSKTVTAAVVQNDGLTRLPDSSSGPNANGTDTATLVRFAKLKPKTGDIVKVTVATASKGICRYLKPTLSAVKPGLCNVTVSVTSPKSKKTVSKKVSVRVT